MSDEFIDVSPEPSPQVEGEFFENPEKTEYNLRNRDRASDIRLKRRYFLLTRTITTRWVWFIVAATIAQFFGSVFDRGLSDAAFIALITTTTATLLGFWGLVGAYLFRFEKRSPDQKI